MMVRPTVATKALIPDDSYRYESARGWPDLHDSTSKNQRELAANSGVTSFIPTKVGCDQATGREAPKP